MGLIAVGGFQHETNTFAPSKAGYAAFQDGGGWPPLVTGDCIAPRLAGANIPAAGAIGALRALGHRTAGLVWAAASPSAHVTRDAYERIVGDMLARLAALGPVDGVYLDLHGAMVTEHFDDGEGELLARVRQVVGARVPIVASLDLHANVSRAMFALADGLVAYRTYPHVDMAATGDRAAQLLERMLKDGRAPSKSFRVLDFLTGLPSQCTLIEPAKSLYHMLERLEREHHCVLSFTPGFPMADFPECGMAVTGYGIDAARAETATAALANAIADAEGEFSMELFEPDAAVVRAMQRGEPGAPVVLADTQDNPGAGGNGDTTGLLAALLARRAPGAVLGLLIDPASAAQAQAIGVGRKAPFALGEISGVPGHTPYDGEFTVVRLGDGRFTCTGPMFLGFRMELGPMAVLEKDGVRVVLASKKCQAADQEMFRHVGIEPKEQRILALKSSVHFRADFEPIAREVLVVVAPGPAKADPTMFSWSRLRAGLRLKPKGPPFVPRRPQRIEVMRRYVIALIKHETNTFSPIATPIMAFGHGNGPAFGDAARLRFAGTNTPMGAYLDLATREGAEIVTPVAAEAWPANKSSRATFEQLVRPLEDAVRKGCDAAMLDLHGAMVVEDCDDAEGEIVKRLRAIAPALPIAVTLDYHTNLSADLVDNATVITGYKTYPHVDMYDVGKLAGEILVRTRAGEIEPVMAWGWLPLLASVMRHAPEDGPSGDIVRYARAMEAAGNVLAATFFASFPHADTPYTGVSAIVVGDAKRDGTAAAREVCDRMLAIASRRRDEYAFIAKPLVESVSQAKHLGATATHGPVLLIDHCDNCGSGGAQDVMMVVAEILRQELDDVAIAPIRDAVSVAQMIATGVGNEVTLHLGGKTAMPSIGLKGEPLQVRGHVRTITDGEFVITGPMYTGIRTFLGRTAVLDTGRAQIVVTERAHEPMDLGVFTHCGIDPRRKKFIMLKSRIHYRAGFKPIASHIVECAGAGVTNADLSVYRYEKLQRPIWPLDPI